MMHIVKRLSISTLGGLLAYFLFFIASMVAARWLGPEEFGKYAVVFSIASSLAVFFVLGLDNILTYLIARSSKLEQKDYLTASLQIFGVVFAGVSVLYGLGVLFLQNIIPFESNILLFGYILAITIASKRIMDIYFRSYEMYREQVISKIAEGSVILVLLTLSTLWLSEFWQYTIFIIISGGIFILFGIYFLREHISFFRVVHEKRQVIANYFSHGIVNGSAEIVGTLVDKLIIATTLGYTQAGIYAFYAAISILFIARIMNLVINVYLPTVSKISDKHRAFSQLNRVLWYSFVPVFFGALVGMRVLLELFGKGYPVEWYWIIILSVYVVVYGMVQLYQSFLIGLNEDGAHKQARDVVVSIIIFLISVASLFFLDAIAIGMMFFILLVYKLVMWLFYRNSIRKILHL